MSSDGAALNPGLEPVLPLFDWIPIPMWLVSHRELHTSRRTRLEFEFLAKASADYLGRSEVGTPAEHRT